MFIISAIVNVNDLYTQQKEKKLKVPKTNTAPTEMTNNAKARRGEETRR